MRIAIPCFVILLVLTAWPANPDEPEPDWEGLIKARCTRRWSGNQVRKYKCIKKQVAANKRLAKLAQGLPEGSDEYQIIVRCWSMWVGVDGKKADHEKAFYCAKREIELKQEQPPSPIPADTP